MRDPLMEGFIEKARRSIAAARRLLADGDFDFAASRAYYAMFYAAEALLLSAGKTLSKHSAVIGTFGKDFAHAGVVPAQLHRYLIDAFDLRNASDYHIGRSVTREGGEVSIAHAQEFVDEVARVLGLDGEEGA